MEIKKIKKNKGFVILFAVTLSSILLLIALGVANIAFKEIKFSTSARDTNDAFFAADTGAEAVLFQDFKNSFYSLGAATEKTWEPISITGLGSNGTSCAIVTIKKDTTTSPTDVTTKVVSKGYNNGTDEGICVPGANSVERQLELNY